MLNPYEPPALDQVSNNLSDNSNFAGKSIIKYFIWPYSFYADAIIVEFYLKNETPLIFPLQVCKYLMTFMLMVYFFVAATTFSIRIFLLFRILVSFTFSLVLLYFFLVWLKPWTIVNVPKEHFVNYTVGLLLALSFLELIFSIAMRKWLKTSTPAL